MIDGATNQKIAKIPAGNDIRALCWNSTNNKIYSANAGSNTTSNTVTVIDGATNSVITTIPVGECPIAFTYNPLQNRVYVANYRGSSISVIRDLVPGVEESEIATPSARNDFVVYPNPASSFFIVRGPLMEVKLRMRSLTSLSQRISPDGIKNGIYFVRVDNVSDIEKLVITK